MIARKLVTMDPSKLSFFARAQAVRAGAMGTHGALSGGFSGFGMTFDEGLDFSPGSPDDPGTAETMTFSPMDIEAKAPPDPAMNKGTFDTLASGLNDIFKLVAGGPRVSGGTAGAAFAPPSPVPLIIGGIALLVGGIIVVKMMK